MNTSFEQWQADDDSQLSDLEHVRKRPLMYICDTRTRGLHLCVLELIDYANNRNARRIAVSLNDDGSVAVTDDGRGCDPKTLEQSMTDLMFDKQISQPCGSHGVGPVVVNFLAAKFEVETSTSGGKYRQFYRCGVAITPVERIGHAASDSMKIVLLPDSSIFQTTQLQPSIVEKRLEELSFLRLGVEYSFVNEYAHHRTFYSERGAEDFVNRLNQHTGPTHPTIVLQGEEKGIYYDIAFQYNSTFRDQTKSYGNDWQSHEGGYHVNGYKHSLVRQLKQIGLKQGISLDLVEDDDTFYHGLTSVIAVRLENPQWQGPTKTKLMNKEMFGVIEAAMEDFLPAYIAGNPATAMAVFRKVRQSAEMRRTLPPIDRQH